MLTRTLLAALAVAIAITATPSEARPPEKDSKTSPFRAPAIDVAAIPAYPTAGQAKAQRQTSRAASRSVVRPRADRQARKWREASPAASNSEMTYLPHPAGCPAVNFCACGAASEIYGEPRRSLWPVSAWYGFERTSPGAGMVAIMHRHHLVVLKHQVDGSNWVVHDYNSGGHRSRRQVVNIARATIVDPRSALASYSARKHRTAPRHPRVRLAHYGR